jgi:hypothetical protein
VKFLPRLEKPGSAATFDAVLWFQGTAAVPYLEEGPKTRPDVWDRLWQPCEGELFLFAAWFN